MAESKLYRFVGNLSPDQRFDQVQAGDKTLKLHKPEEGKFGNAEKLTASQADELRLYVALEEVPDDLAGEYVFGAETPEGGEPAPVAPDLDAMSFQDLQKLAKERDVPDRGGKSEGELRELVRNHIQSKGA